MLFVDLDHFKAVNDEYGHAAGDRVLKAVADALRGRTRVFDSIGRYGGDEFIALMPGTSPGDAQSAAERLRSAIEALGFSPPEGPPALSISIGVACTGGRPVSAETLLSEADGALYAAKRAGRNRVHLAG